VQQPGSATLNVITTGQPSATLGVLTNNEHHDDRRVRAEPWSYAEVIRFARNRQKTQ
jgi:hypothetical protein